MIVWCDYCDCEDECTCEGCGGEGVDDECDDCDCN